MKHRSPDTPASPHTYVDLLIIDEMLPCDFSPFRTLEYNHYLSFYDSSMLVSTQGWHAWVSNLRFDEHLSKSDLAPAVKSKIKRLDALERTIPSLAYITFLHNAFEAFPLLEERRIPFVLQLYPGGGFELNNQQSDQKLKILAQSPLCRKIITTQTISRQYLLEKIGCAPEKIEFIYGGVYDTRQDFDFLRDKKLFGRDKDTIDICFVAHRYGDDVKKKGYDQFVAVAQAFARSHPHMRFHVVGDYTADQLPLGVAADQITFHGRKPNDFFRDFYPKMDMILSVNRPANGLQGAFDGFPTGACMEAGFRGVLNLISDPLALNVAFTDGENIVIVDENTERTIARIAELVADPEFLYRISYANWKAFHHAFSTDNQLWARTKIIAGQLLAREALIIRPSAFSGTHSPRVAQLLELNAALLAGLKDTEHRHDNLLQEYRKLAAGWEELRGVVLAQESSLKEYAELNEAAAHAHARELSLARAPLELTGSLPLASHPKSASHGTFRSLVSRFKQKFRRSFFS